MKLNGLTIEGVPYSELCKRVFSYYDPEKPLHYIVFERPQGGWAAEFFHDSGRIEDLDDILALLGRQNAGTKIWIESREERMQKQF